MMSVLEQSGDRTELVAVRGRLLSAVAFVQDYVQLQFDGPLITLLEWPEVHINGLVVVSGKPGYRDALCTLIGKVVESAFVRPGDQLRITFTGAAPIFVVLRLMPCVNEETVIFTNGNSEQWGVW